MKILAIDSATQSCSVAITDNFSLLAELTAHHGKTHATSLMAMIQLVLAQTGLTLMEIGGIAVTIGPGSFTGLRIGLSSVKGLAKAVGKPVVGISSIDAIVYPFVTTSKCICPMIDARKGQVYSAIYRQSNGNQISKTPIRSVTPLQAIEEINEPCVFLGNGAILYKDFVEQHLGKLALFPHPYCFAIHACVVAYLSIPKFVNNHIDNIESLIPIYARKSDAETQTFQAKTKL